MPDVPFSPARRRWLRLALAAALPQPWRSAAALRRPRLMDEPFPLGVASGPAGADGLVLWTR
ncbi:MAG: hypothetical protein N2483_08880, partial [Burkholderiaceae bacterium]|nr:hypothetical protein [Burkholderiaceae bacterium]